MADDTIIEGGCHCDAVRYRITGDIIDAGYCHCDICRQTTGAPVLAWASVPAENFEYIEGRPTIYASSDWGQREFCGNCGTQLCYRETEDPDAVDVNIGSLDDPELFEPEYHLHTAEQLDWFETDDDLPRFEGPGPGDEEEP